MIGRVCLPRRATLVCHCRRIVTRKYVARSGLHDDNTKQLSKNIRQLEYKIETGKKKANAPTPTMEDAEVSAIYQELSAPSQPRRKIKSDYMENLRAKFLDTRPILAEPAAAPVAEEGTAQPVGDTLTTVSDEAKALQVSVGDFEKLIYANALAKRPEAAEEALALMEHYKCTPSVRCYNHLMDAYANSRKVDSVIGVFKRLRKANLGPDMYSYSVLIKALALNSRVEDALITFEKIKKMGIVPTQPIFASLISGCLKAHRIDQAWDLFDSMRLSYHQPDEVTFTMMLHACAKRGEVERALNLFEDMIGHRLYPTDVTFNVLINACAKRPDYFDEAFNLFDQMQTVHGFQPDIVTYNTLLSACARKKDLERARTIFKTLIEPATENNLVAESQDDEQLPQITPCDQTYTNLFWCYANYRPPNASENASHIDTTQQQPTTEPVALEKYKVIKDTLPQDSVEIVQEAKRVFAYLVQQGVLVTPDMLNQYLAVHVYQQQLEECFDIYQNDFEKHQVERNAYTFKHMLRLCYQTNDTSLAWKIWEDYQDFLENRIDLHRSPNDESVSLRKRHEAELLARQIREGWTLERQRGLAVSMANTLARSSDDLTQARRFLQVQFHKDRPLAMCRPTLRSLFPMYNQSIYLDDQETKMAIHQLCANTEPKKWRSHLAYKFRRVTEPSS